MQFAKVSNGQKKLFMSCVSIHVASNNVSAPCPNPSAIWAISHVNNSSIITYTIVETLRDVSGGGWSDQVSPRAS